MLSMALNTNQSINLLFINKEKKVVENQLINLFKMQCFFLQQYRIDEDL
jgi:hypothetical protein